MSSEPLLTKDGKDRHSFDFPPREGDFLLPQLSVKLKDEIIVMNKGRWRRAWIVQWGHRRIVDPFVVILRRGLEPKLLSLSMALGLTFGLFPLCGVALLLCAIAAVILQSNCHVPTLMLANFVASPFELGLLVPFARVGELVTGEEEHFIITPGGFWEAIREHEPRAFMFGILHAVIGWSVFAPISIAFLYITTLPIFRCLIARFGPNQVLQGHSPINDGHVVVKQESTSSDYASV